MTPFTPREAVQFEREAGTTLVHAGAALAAGTPSARVCVAGLWILGLRDDDSLTVDDVLDRYGTYGELLDAALAAMTSTTGDDG